jgi:ketosteroid isomerase-like protein
MIHDLTPRAGSHGQPGDVRHFRAPAARGDAGVNEGSLEMPHTLGFDRRRLLAASAAAALLPLDRLSVSDDRAEIADLLVRFRRVYEALDVAATERILAEDIEFSDPTFHLKATGMAEMRKMMIDTTPAFQSIRINVEHELVAPPWAVVRQEQVAVRKSPPGLAVRVRGVSLYRIDGGRIRGWHDYYDSAGYERQLREAATPWPAGGR